MEHLELVELKQEELRKVEGGILTGITKSWFVDSLNAIVDFAQATYQGMYDNKGFCECK